jgi:plastocyanin
MRWKHSISVLASTGLLAIVLAVPARADATVTVGVGHFDAANQDPSTGTLVQYTDFFGRSVRVHSGDTVNFQTQKNEFHSIALAPAVIPLPVFVADTDDAPAKGTGLPKVAGGPGLFKAFAPPTCGLQGTPTCVFDGGSPVDAGAIGGFDPTTGQPMNVDWNVKITAPTGDYAYFCYIHPGMEGVLHVVPSGAASDSGNQLTSPAGEAQFQQDRSEATSLMASDNNAAPSGAPGSRTWSVHVGDTTSTLHASILAMMPSSLPNIVSGDTVKFLWGAFEPHTVGFGPDANLPGPFGWDCGKTYVAAGPGGPGAPAPCTEFENGQPEIIGDPGTRGPGQALNRNQVTDSGVLVGSAYGVTPGAEWWSVAAAQPGTYQYHCTVHDFMVGTISVAGA